MMNEIVTEKKCSRCGEIKPLSLFQKDKRKKLGYGSWCLRCNRENTRKWVEKFPEKNKTSFRKWYEKNVEYFRGAAKLFRTRHPDELYARKRKYFLSHKEEHYARNKKWNDTHKEVIKQWGIENHDRVRERQKEWLSRNKWKSLQDSRTRRARKKGAEGFVSAKEWESLKETYCYTCLRCGKKEPEIKLTLDHVIPLKMGGKHVIENAQPLCVSCNCSKGARIADYRI